MINILVVEDSAVSQQLLVHILERDPDVHIVGVVGNGEAAVEFVSKRKPDVITMDILMPKLDGIEATRRIMAAAPVPIVIVSGAWSPLEVATTFRALEAGAVALVEKPSGADSPEARVAAQRLVDVVKSMAEVRVVRRWAKKDGAGPAPLRPRVAAKEICTVAIGLSTGGPPVLRALLLRLPKDFPAPILVVQHMSAGFLPGFVDWLRNVGCVAEIAEHGLLPRAGCAYLAPDGKQMGLDASGRIALSNDVPENGLRPSAAFLFRSVADAYGARSAGILLTGMGRDGAAELKYMRDCGAVTFAQDLESSVVHGMPGEAIRLGGATYVLPPEKIADLLAELVCK